MARRPVKKIRTTANGPEKTGPIALAAAFLLFSACATKPADRIILPQKQEQETEKSQDGAYTIIDWQGRAEGQDIPEWVRRFLDGGNREVETMLQYRNRYTFVAAARDSSLDALRYWSEEFSDRQDFPRLAAVRIEERLAAAAALYPDDEYGEFFEAMVKRASDTDYYGVVRREDSYWLLRRFYTENDEEVNNEAYDFFILVSIDRGELAARIRMLLDDPEGIRTPDRDQAAAVNRIRGNFFNGF
jgi:hypothetical protein